MEINIKCSFVHVNSEITNQISVCQRWLCFGLFKG